MARRGLNRVRATQSTRASARESTIVQRKLGGPLLRAMTLFFGLNALYELCRLFDDGIAQHVTAAPDGLDVVVAIGRRRELFSEFADEHVDDLQLRFVHAAIEMIEEHLLGESRALP